MVFVDKNLSFIEAKSLAQGPENQISLTLKLVVLTPLSFLKRVVVATDSLAKEDFEVGMKGKYLRYYNVKMVQLMLCGSMWHNQDQ